MASWRGVGPSFWAPSSSLAFRWLLIPRLLSAFFMHISDCDETFNYWEPVREERVGIERCASTDKRAACPFVRWPFCVGALALQVGGAEISI